MSVFADVQRAMLSSVAGLKMAKVKQSFEADCLDVRADCARGQSGRFCCAECLNLVGEE